MKAKKTGATAAPPGPDVNYYNEADDTGKADTNMEPGFVGSNYEALQETPATQNKTEGMLSKLKQRISLSLLLLWFLSVMLSIGISYAIVWSTIPQHTIKQLKQENRIPSDTLAGYALKFIHKTNLSCDGTAAAGMAQTGNQLIVVCKYSNVTNIYDLETLNYTRSAIVPGLYGQAKISIISIQQSVYICGDSETYISSTYGWRYGYKIWKSVLTLNSTHGEFVRWEVWRELNFSAVIISPASDGGIMVANSANLTFLDNKAKIVKIVPILVTSSARNMYHIYGSFLKKNGNYVLHAGFSQIGYYGISIAFMTLASGVSQQVIYIEDSQTRDYPMSFSSFSIITVGPDDYVFHASCGPFPEISIMDWNVTSVKVLANHKTHDLKCEITGMIYHHDSGRLIISEALESFWAGAFTVSPNSLKIFQVIQPERRK